ncbi:hypothetical protein SGFS_089720 [Streptomyces graminofaciens]|uniref:Transposase n=1 Tax=Streptomyces graminofaciens TaxID=68212 RepID=A0ABM7FMX2_9ACTN|nr:hypothetical protein SGFS_089720 [Streptomyces graminofaciens]
MEDIDTGVGQRRKDRLQLCRGVGEAGLALPRLPLRQPEERKTGKSGATAARTASTTSEAKRTRDGRSPPHESVRRLVRSHCKPIGFIDTSPRGLALHASPDRPTGVPLARTHGQLA